MKSNVPKCFVFTWIQNPSERGIQEPSSPNYFPDFFVSSGKALKGKRASRVQERVLQAGPVSLSVSCLLGANRNKNVCLLLSFRFICFFHYFRQRSRTLFLLIASRDVSNSHLMSTTELLLPSSKTPHSSMNHDNRSLCNTVQYSSIRQDTQVTRKSNVVAAHWAEKYWKCNTFHVQYLYL